VGLSGPLIVKPLATNTLNMGVPIAEKELILD
jgi:hypothetical protein